MARKRKKPLINDPLAPTKYKVKLPSGKKITIKRKRPNDKGRFDAEMREQYLTLIGEGLTNRDAASACGCGTRYFQRRRKEDPQFEEDYQTARESGNDVIRAEIKRRAVDGIKQAVYHDGMVVGHKQVYSDNLLIFLAKSRMDEFKENQHEVTHTHRLDGAAEQLTSKLAAILGIAEEDTGTILIPE